MLTTIFSSNSPIDCHILKGRLEIEGIDCYIFDDLFVWIYPFYAVAIGGVKLNVPDHQASLANEIIQLLRNKKLLDEEGEYDLTETFENEISKQDEILHLKSRIRQDPTKLNIGENLTTSFLTLNEKSRVLEAEREFQKESALKLNFTWEQFWYELFDFDQSIFKYLRIHSPEYYLEKELVGKVDNSLSDNPETNCPICASDNVSYGLSISYHWNILYLFLGLFFSNPAPLVRNRYHCFQCGNEFKIRKEYTGFDKAIALDTGQE